MNCKERLLATINGESTDRLPFLPRLDLWYRANKLNGALPAKYSGATLEQILADMDLGMHAVIPDFQDLRSPDDDVDRVLGIFRLWFMPYVAELKNVKRVVEYNGDETIVEYQTPKGNLRSKVIYNDDMKKAGITITHIHEHVIKTKDDFAPVGYIFENTEVTPNYAGYQKFKDRIGGNGLAVACTLLAASPRHLIMRELMSMEDFFLMSFDYPEEMAQLEKSISIFFNKVFDIVADSSAEIIISGANYDSAVTNPPFFKEYITPELRRQSDILHKKGKLLLTHPDGENEGLLQEYVDSGIDVADSVCPSPMTNLSISEYRVAFKDKITIWGGVPSAIMLKDIMSDDDFYKYMDQFMLDIGRGDRLIVSVADTMPPGAEFDRIKHIAKLVGDFGHVVV